MTTISIPSSVAAILRKANLPARLVDEQGNVLGSFSPIQSETDELTPEQIAEMKRRLAGPGPWCTTEQLLAHIDSVDKAQ
jgi:hypothetical protein